MNNRIGNHRLGGQCVCVSVFYKNKEISLSGLAAKTPLVPHNTNSPRSSQRRGQEFVCITTDNTKINFEFNN